MKNSVFVSKTYLFRDHPFFYVTLADLAPGMGLLQIHSDWGTYSHFWGAMGEDTKIKEFLARCNSDYIETKLRCGTSYMGVKKSSEILLTKFMAHCWPRFKEEMQKSS